jgi:hypothetical protein
MEDGFSIILALVDALKTNPFDGMDSVSAIFCLWKALSFWQGGGTSFCSFQAK